MCELVKLSKECDNYLGIVGLTKHPDGLSNGFYTGTYYHCSSTFMVDNELYAQLKAEDKVEGFPKYYEKACAIIAHDKQVKANNPIHIFKLGELCCNGNTYNLMYDKTSKVMTREKKLLDDDMIEYTGDTNCYGGIKGLTYDRKTGYLYATGERNIRKHNGIPFIYLLETDKIRNYYAWKERSKTMPENARFVIGETLMNGVTTEVIVDRKLLTLVRQTCLL